VSKYPAIPEPQKTLESLHETVKILKDVVEQLAGMRGDAGSARVFTGERLPKDAKGGDLWVTGKDTSYYTGGQWVRIPVKELKS
jgi:hypothetical protein